AALVVVLVGDAFVAVEEVVLAVTVEQADQQGLEVKAGGAVEAVVYDDPHLTQVLLLPRLQMLTHPAVRAAGLAHVDVMPVLDQVYDRPVGEAGESGPRLRDGLLGEAQLLDLKAGHTSCSAPWPSRWGTSVRCVRASSGLSLRGPGRACPPEAVHRSRRRRARRPLRPVQRRSPTDSTPAARQLRSQLISQGSPANGTVASHARP